MREGDETKRTISSGEADVLMMAMNTGESYRKGESLLPGWS